MMNHAEIGTGHIVVGLLHEGDGVAGRALAALGADLDSAREALAKRLPSVPGPLRGHIPFTTRANRACEMAQREALNLGHTYIGTEHVLLGLVAEGDDAGVSVLTALGISPGDARAQVMELLDGYVRSEAAGSRPAAADGDLTSRAASLRRGIGAAPARGDDTEAWLRRRRDEYPGTHLEWFAIDRLLDDYRLHADLGAPLDREVPSDGS